MTFSSGSLLLVKKTLGTFDRSEMELHPEILINKTLFMRFSFGFVTN